MTRVVTVAETRDEVEAMLWRGALGEAGIAAQVAERGVAGAFGGARLPHATSYRLLVPQADVVQARNLVTELSGAGSLVALPNEQREAAAGSVAVFILGGVGILAAVVVAVAVTRALL